MSKLEMVRPSVHDLYKNVTSEGQQTIKQHQATKPKRKGTIRKGRAFLALILMIGGGFTLLLTLITSLPTIYKVLNSKLLSPVEPYLLLFGVWSPLLYSAMLVLFFVWIYCTYQAIRLFRKEAREKQ